MDTVTRRRDLNVSAAHQGLRDRLRRAIDRESIGVIADRAGMAPEALYRILTLKNSPTLETIERLAAAIDESADALIRPIPKNLVESA